MKVIEKIITYQDYNYVEGILQFKAYGSKTHDFLNAEYFSIDRISHVRLEVDKKYLPPQLPPGINKNKVSTLSFPDKITTIVDGDYSKPYSIAYDEIIVDDNYVDSSQNIIGPRFNSTKIGTELSSTVSIKVYGLIKIERERKETENQYEITTIAHGAGKIELSPKKDSYSTGEKVSVKAVPDINIIFLGYRNEFKNISKEFELLVEEEDIVIEADFIDIKKAEELLKSNNVENRSTYNLDTLKDDFQKIKSKQNQSQRERLKNAWKQPSIKSKRLGINAKGMWEIIGSVISILFYLFVLIILIAVFGKVFFLLVGLYLVIWSIGFLSSYVLRWSVFRWILGFLFVMIILTGVVNVFESFKSSSRKPYKIENDPYYELEEVVKENTTIDYKHHIKWEDYDGFLYETDLIINSDLVEKAKIHKNGLPAVTTEQSYHSLLNDLYSKSIDDDYFFVREKLDSLKLMKRISSRQFIEVIVSMIQSIPYYAILENSCNPYSYQDPAIRELLTQQPCEPNIKHGIKAPAEFLKDLKGDCDTRTLFLYGLLKSLNYDVAIFGSQKYKHSILGIAMNYEGPHFKIINNKKYFLWEVTGKDFKPGILPKNIANLNYWNINLK